MPLHLLGKKSWNVYNKANIERVRRDEAQAKAAVEAEEERMQALDAERRMQILRGETPTAVPSPPSPISQEHHGHEGRQRKRRKRYGENDTDFEMRIARELAEEARDVDGQLMLRKQSMQAKEVCLTDERGNISLFGKENKKENRSQREKNPQTQREEERKKREYEDQYTMRFSNAGGFQHNLGEAPWYSKGGTALQKEGEIEELGLPSKDVWGNEDPRRKEREKSRIMSSDPLAIMKAGARKVREVENERRLWREERDNEGLQSRADRKKARRQRRKVDDGEQNVDDFSLDGTPGGRRIDRERERERVSHRRYQHRDNEYRHSTHQSPIADGKKRIHSSHRRSRRREEY